MKKLLLYLNPIAHLGDKRYSILFPLLVNLSICILSEVFAYIIVKDPMVVGAYIIFFNVASIMYFAFRNGIRGGFIATSITIIYYAYIIYTRHYKGAMLFSGIETTVILTFLYFFLAAIIGGLKQTIDTLIEREADEKKRLQAIVQQLPVGVLITDNKGKLLLGNKQVDTILGIKIPVGFVIGKDTLPKATIDGKSINPSHAPLAHALSTGKSVVGKEFVYEGGDGKQKYLQVNASAIHNKSGKIIAAASIINDITQQKEMEARKDDFVNMASHELKTPITSMKLYIDSLMNRIQQYNDERAIKTLSGIKNQTERLQELVNDLLDVSRLQTGKLNLSKERFNIDELITEIIEALQGMTKKQKILFSHKTHISVNADRFRIYQVFTNLITNAVKYSPVGADIIVRAKKDNGKVTVSVQDFGIGIEKEQQKKIFDRLYQVTGPKEKTFPGLGMGLYISKEIIKRHRGTLWVESEKEKGSTFYFSLPLLRGK